MSEGHPLKRLPKLLNPRKLAYQEAILQGVVEAKALPRLSAAAGCSDGVEASLSFYVSEAGKVQLGGEVKANLAHQCQRCMQMMAPREEQARIHLAVVRSEDEAKQLPNELDPWVVPEEEGDIHALIEEELLLVVPVAAYHDYECIDASLYSAGEDESPEEPKKANPFQVLDALKKQ